MRKGMFKRFFAVLLSLVMVMGLLPGMTRPAEAADFSDETQPGASFRIDIADLFNVDWTDGSRFYMCGETQPTSGSNSGHLYHEGSEQFYDNYAYSYLSNEDFLIFIAYEPGIYTFYTKVYDELDSSFEQIRSIQITVSGNAPTDITLSSSSIKAVDTGVGATVGTLITADADAGDSHTYSLVTGSGDTNNSDFQISGATLQTSKVLAAGSYSILVKSTDSGSLACEKAFTINVFTSPSVTTNAASSKSATGATLNGTVNAGNASTTVTFEYGTSNSYGTTVTAAESPVTGISGTSVSKAITGLTPNTTYHYRVSGVNTAGTVNGSDLTFTTGTLVPVATTDAADGITTSAATLHGTVNPNNEGTTVTFQYGTTATYGSTATADQSPVTGTGNTSVSYGLTGLAPNTTYHYRVVAVNMTGTTNGSDQTFTTLPLAPSVTTGSASGLAPTGATVAGTVNANNASTTATFEYGLDTSYGSSVTALQSPVTGTGNTDVSAVLYSLLPNTTYHFRATGVNAGGTTNGSDATFTTAKAKPVAITDDTCILGTFGTTVHAMVNANNDDTTVTFEYGLTSSYGASVSAVPGTATGSNGKVVKGDLAGLTPNTTYHFRVVAINSAGRTEGSDETFTTLAEYPAVTTGSASDIVSTGATLNGSVIANNADTAVTFQYGLDTSYGSFVSAVPGTATGMGNTDVSAALTGLLPNTTYHFRAVGQNAAGPANGSDAFFTTRKAKPAATTGTAGGLSSSGATLNGTVNASNESTTVTFEYGLSTGYGTTVTATPSTATGSGNTPVSSILAGLTPNTTYHYRVVAENPTGTTNGLDQTFTTSAVAPSVATGSAGIITSSGAVLAGAVNANNADTAVTFQYGLTTSYGSTVTAVPDTVTGTGNTSVSAVLSDLLPNSDYHFKVVGVNIAGTTDGLDATFTTGKAAPSAATNDANSIASTAATLNGTVNAMNDSTTVTFEYGLTDTYGSYATADQSPVTGTSDTSVSKAITGLTPNTTYHYRVVAVNSTDTVYGSDHTFSTPLKPAVTLTADTADNDVDHPLEITFAADAAFEAGITSVTYHGATLAAPSDYEVASGKITLKPAGVNAALHTSGTANLVISAAGYNDSSVSQTITAGAAAAMEITAQPVPGTNSGDVFLTQPQVTLKDQYGNVCADGPSSSATVIAIPKPGIPGSGSWTIGGTDTVSAVNGIAIFSDLTCDLMTAGTSAIVFLPGPDIAAVPGAESEPFTIPLRSAVTLTADTTDNSVDNVLELDFGSASHFAESVTGITYNGTALTEGTDYELYKDSIALIPAGGNPALTTPATATLTVAADGFRDSSVTQTITAGEATGFAMSAEPLPGPNSGDAFATQPAVILKDQYGNTCTDGPCAAADVTASAAAGTGTWDIGGTVLKAAASGIVTFDDLTCTQLTYGTGVMNFASGAATGSSAAFNLPLRAALTLTADTSDNSVDQELDIDYNPAPGFAGAISSITFDGVALTEGTDYEVNKDSITLRPAGGNPVLQKPATAQLLIVAEGFRDTSVTQTITAGEAAGITVSVEPLPGQNSGDAFITQPAVILKDQYGNICTDGPSAAADVTVSAANGTGTWNIGGSVTRAAVNGTVTFDGLTCTQLTYGTGVMNFVSGAATGSSAAFNLPMRAAVTLTADTLDNSVDHEMDIGYALAPGFAGAISSITFGGAALTEGTDYEVNKSGIAIKPAGGNPALQKPATALLVITAAGFRDSSVTQTITSGEAAAIGTSVQPVPGALSGDAFSIQPVAVLKDKYGNTCADGPSASAEVTVTAEAGTGKWSAGGTVTRAAVNGIVSFTGLTVTLLDPGTGAVRFTTGTASGVSTAFDLPPKTAAVLYASVSGNSVDDAIEIIFPANADFEKKITGVKYGGTLLAQGMDYTVTSGKITLKPAGGNASLQKPGTATVTVSAAGYKDSAISQTITAGAAASIVVTTQPVPGKVSGDAFATQPKVTLYDRYGNICYDGPSSAALVSVSAAADTGTWTIGGAASRLAVNGVAAFAGLTSVNVTPGMGKMDFTCGAFTVSSTPFAIPERNASISISSARFDKYTESANNKNITLTLALNGNTLDAVRNGSAALVLSTDYTVNADTVVIKKEYLARQPKGTVKLTFDFSQGTDPVLSVTVSDSTPASSSEGTPAVNVIVNGEGQDAGSVSTTEKDGKTETTVTVDNGKLLKILDAKGNNASVVIPVKAGSSVSSVVMNGQMMSTLQTSQATLQVQTETSTYTLPSNGLNMDEVAKELGENVPKDEVKVNITISEPPAGTVQVVEDAAAAGNFAIMVPAVEFKVECSYNDQTVEVKSFNAYVERTIAIPDGVDPYKITTAVVVRPDGTTYHVPTKITVIDGKYYAVINSLTNSTYTVIWHPVAFEDMEGHWAKEAVNDMGSRMVVTGVDEKNYAPDMEITRADFVAFVVRALGLNPGEGVNPYADVLDTDWYCGYVKTAAAYKLLTGDGTAPFSAQETVSREEAMAMIKRAMEIADMEITLNEGEAQALLQAYGDAASVTEAEKENVASCLKAEVTFDLHGGNLLPKAPVTRAEAAVILRLLLQKAELI